MGKGTLPVFHSRQRSPLTLMVALVVATGAQNSTLPVYVEALLHLMNLTFDSCRGIDWCTVKNDNHAEEFAYMKGCCPACSCDQHCSQNISCCPDFLLTRLVGNKVFQNIHDLREALSEMPQIELSKLEVNHGMRELADNEECIYTKLNNGTRSMPKLFAYVIVNKCENGTQDIDVVRKCESPGTYVGVDSIEYFIPVQSNSTGIAYRNKYCAKCNGEVTDEVEEWDAVLATLDMSGMEPFGMIVSMTELFIMDEVRYISFEPQARHDARVCYNHENGGTCRYDVDVQATLDQVACEMFEYPLPMMLLLNFSMHKNTACLHCAGLSVQEIVGACRSTYLLRNKKPLVARINNRHIPRASWQAGTRLHRRFSQHCPLGEVYDGTAVSSSQKESS